MALLTDGGISAIESLQGLDAAVLDVARVERIDLARKLSMADEEVTLRVKRFLLEHGLEGRVAGADGEIDARRVVVTPAVRRWHSLLALALTYSDAYFSQLNDRYRGKWEHYRDRAAEAADLAFVTGVGAVWNAAPRAGAAKVAGSGVPGTDATYFVSVSWKNSQGAEGAPSEPVLFAATGELIRVRPSEAAPGAGWTFEVYAGTSDDSMTKQTLTPVADGQEWLMPGVGLITGAPMGEGQAPDYYLRHVRHWQRG